MYCVGLTGTISSGKSTALTHFGQLGIDTLSADNIARSLTTQHSPALAKICQHFGGEILLQNLELNRRQLRQRILNNPSDRVWLENLLHPLIQQEIKLAVTQCKSPYCVIEIPLLTNKATYPYLNRILVITTTQMQQLIRLKARDHCSEEEALSLLHLQKNNAPTSLADDVILNTGLLSELHQTIEKLHQHYLELATRSQ